MIRAFCFDMDGVLLDTEHLGGTLMTDLIAQQGFHVTQAQWQSLVGTSWPYTYRQLESWFPGFDSPRFERQWQEATFVDYFQRQGVPFKPGARELLAWLKAQGYRLALCTSNLPQVVRTYLDMAGWSDTFEFVVTADMVAHSKPAPDIYLRGAALMGVSPAECVGIEDSPSGLRAVRAAGMTSIFVPDVIPFTEELAPFADHVLTSLNEVRSALQLAEAAHA